MTRLIFWERIKVTEIYQYFFIKISNLVNLGIYNIGHILPSSTMQWYVNALM